MFSPTKKVQTSRASQYMIIHQLPDDHTTVWSF